jgi:ubiquinone/menaquinone biosynthesis C-methylase UbiE
MEWYRELFQGLAKTYDELSFTQGTVQEVDFIERELGESRNLRILDLGCGTGRHSVELSRRGYRIVGLDLSHDQLHHGAVKCRDQSVSLQLIQGDARRLCFRPAFDGVLMLCEGAFCLMETDQMNFQILRNVARVLKPSGLLIMTALNALHALAGGGEPGSGPEIEGFDSGTFRTQYVLTIADDSGREMRLQVNERYYAPSELRWLLESVGMGEVEIFGCHPGRYEREVKVSGEHPEMLVLARRTGIQKRSGI